jgi:hypothetical protein
MLFERIVCGVDGSPAGFEALRQAATIRPPDRRLVAVIVPDASVHAETGMTRKAGPARDWRPAIAEAQIVEGPSSFRRWPPLLQSETDQQASLTERL